VVRTCSDFTINFGANAHIALTRADRYNVAMHIVGRITGIKYAPLLGEPLSELDFDQFDINDSPTACVVHDGKYTFALSKWVSPRRFHSCKNHATV